MTATAKTVSGSPRKLGYYDRGATPYFASRADQRFSYCLFVPEDYEIDGQDRYDLVVLVHGTARWAEHYRSAFADFCRRQRAIVLAPLFPAGVTAPGELSSYKLMRDGGIAYDRVLLDMVAEVTGRYRLRGDRFLMHGFSGGGHFSHRFLYLHPERLLGVSIGAPGIVTLLDVEHDFWVGLRNFEQIFGKPLDLAAIRRVPVHLVIGAEDKETWEIRLTPQDSWWMPGAERLAEANRLERMAALRASLEAHGVACVQDIVAGAGHDGRAMLEPVQAWMATQLGRVRAE
ncbi:alpha/beta hydrolase [Mesorhizobium sp. B2-3-4]|uniref:alpha/beta hydrolase n=1 Tax=Mesorhizobium sp. B2-3-4 TaxID=2589959 RepID=UPI00112A6751|nr:alpha/beta hydrolase [Mesorhizobium sp. B2-3-4]TPM40861.1 alpha/beta hydrolase [Mesorhizobium sp. B2-3-4]